MTAEGVAHELYRQFATCPTASLEGAREQVARVLRHEGMTTAKIGACLEKRADVEAARRVPWSIGALGCIVSVVIAAEACREGQGYAYKLIRDRDWAQLCPDCRESCAGTTKVIVAGRPELRVSCPIARRDETGRHREEVIWECPWREAREARRYDEKLDQLGVPSRYRQAQWGLMLPEIAAGVSAYWETRVARIAAGTLLWLAGEAYRGKSCAAALLLGRMATEERVPAWNLVWRTEPTLIAELALYKPKHGELPPQLARADAIVIDEVGGTAMVPVYDEFIKRCRREEPKALICTSNVIWDEVEKAPGWQRAAGRLFEGENWRGAYETGEQRKEWG